MKQRGVLTEEIRRFSEDFLHRKFTVTELRLYPYLDYCFKNGGTLILDKINQEDAAILRLLVDDEQLFVRPGKDADTILLFPTEEFYEFVSKVLLMAYVNTSYDMEDPA